ncbi:enoyl-CoA hydratase/isomerase family protein [Burkholderia guangdongensis]|uniref:enoyl-CoA hydratase/isomerase family protein n=1 Tax=Burkholderia guangdongensis TaxID=1792500 RepID=UPI0015CEF28F|nr:enoyl-CoA hydratase/isomerase family protein [Burkholderia guangdongensis]
MSTTAPSPVLVTRDEGSAEITLNRPETRNAIDIPTAEALGDAIESLERDDTVRAIVLRGADGAFCSGLDLKALQAHPEGMAGFAARWDRVHVGLLRSRKAWIVALERHAVNGGAALALAGDLLVCGERAFMQIGEIRIGMAAPRNVAWLALRHGEAVAARLCLLGERVPAAELLRLGIATEVVDDARTLARARALAATIAAYPAHAVDAIKGGIRAASTRGAPERWFDVCRDANGIHDTHDIHGSEVKHG